MKTSNNQQKVTAADSQEYVILSAAVAGMRVIGLQNTTVGPLVDDDDDPDRSKISVIFHFKRCGSNHA